MIFPADPAAPPAPGPRTPPMDSVYEQGSDGRRRPSSSAALDALVTHVRVEAVPLNLWSAADEAIEAADEETVRHAARRLLALHLHDLRVAEPQVAVRNVRVGDYVRLHGAVHFISRVLNPDKPTITLTAEVHGPGGRVFTYAYDRDVRVSLVARLREEAR